MWVVPPKEKQLYLLNGILSSYKFYSTKTPGKGLRKCVCQMNLQTIVLVWDTVENFRVKVRHTEPVLWIVPVCPLIRTGMLQKTMRYDIHNQLYSTSNQIEFHNTWLLSTYFDQTNPARQWREISKPELNSETLKTVLCLMTVFGCFFVSKFHQLWQITLLTE